MEINKTVRRTDYRGDRDCLPFTIQRVAEVGRSDAKFSELGTRTLGTGAIGRRRFE
jgi:hypothetical protein